MSEMKRAAASLLERRTARFESRHPRAEAERRFDEALDRARIRKPRPFRAAWSDTAEGSALELTFEPAASTRLLLSLSSLAFTLLVAGSAWVILRTDEGALRFLLPLFTVLSILALPFATLGLASNRDALEARIRRAARIALQDEDEAFPPQQRWADED